jgi:hypothetical protein
MATAITTAAGIGIATTGIDITVAGTTSIMITGTAMDTGTGTTIIVIEPQAQ